MASGFQSARVSVISRALARRLAPGVMDCLGPSACPCVAVVLPVASERCYPYGAGTSDCDFRYTRRGPWISQ